MEKLRAGTCFRCTYFLSHDAAHLAHLQLEEASLFLHVLGDLAAAELSADHAVLPGVFPLLFLNLGSTASNTRNNNNNDKTASDLLHDLLILSCDECFIFSQFSLVVFPGFVKRLL